MTGSDHPLPGRIARGGYQRLLRAYPRGFRRRFGADMLADYDRLSEAPRYAGLRGRAALWVRLLRDLLSSAPKEHLRTSARRPPAASGWRPGGLGSDLRQSARNLLARPGFTAIVVATLAVGLGPTTAAYSLAHWLMLRPLPGVADEKELGFVNYGQPVDGGVSVRLITYANLADMEPRLETLVGLAGVQGGSGVAVFDDGSAEALSMEFVTASFFQTLGLEPVAGRFFSAAEDDPIDHGSPVVVISHRLAQARFGEPAAALGELLRLNRRELEVIGVLPRGFHGPLRTDEADLWLPGSSVFWVRNFPDHLRAEARDRGAGFYEFVARLAPEATWAQVEAELAGLNAWLAETWPEANEGLAESRFLIYPGIGTSPTGRALLARTLWLIAAVVGCILVVACANVSNLLLMRSLDRRGEIAVQKALGAGPGRLVRRQLVEALLLCGVGALAGLLVAKGLLRIYQGARLSGLFQPVGDVPMEWQVGGFAGGMCAVVAAFASVLPSLGSIRVDPARWLAESSLTNTGGGRGWRTALGALQLAAAVPLVIGALLFSRTLHELSSVELGFDPGNTQILVVNPSDVGYDHEEQYTYYRQLLDQIAAEPDLGAVTFTSNGPLFAGNHYTRIRPDGAGDDVDVLEPLENEIGEVYFEMLGIPVLHGRTFTADEIMRGPDLTTDLVVLSAGLAERIFGTDRAVGRTVDFAFSLREDRPFRVIGVVGDVQSTDLTEAPTPIAYTPLGVDGRLPSWGLVLVQGSAPGERLRQVAAEVARRVDPELPLIPLRRAPSLQAAVEMHLSERTLLARLFNSLSVTALLLAGIGLYGTVGRSVISRTREIGLRKALGADTARTLAWVLRRALATVLIGATLGCLLGVYGVRFLESRLHGVSTLDPVTWAAAVATLVAVAVLAAAVPARRAIRLDPARALRAER